MRWRRRLAVAAAAVAVVSVFVLSAVAAAESPFGRGSAAIGSSEHTVIGESVEGRPLEVGCLGDGDRTLLLVGGMHTGPEVVSSELVLAFAERIWTGRLEVPGRLTVCILPAVNPDGLESGSHRNANDVDLNRNWPASDWRPVAYHPVGGVVSGGRGPLSEPETSALYDYVAETRPTAVVVWHCCAPVVEASESPRAEMLAREYAEASGLTYIDRWTDYEITGEFIDAMDRIGIPALDVEMLRPDDTDLERHEAGLQALFDALSAPQITSRPATPQVTAGSARETSAPSGSAGTVYRVQPGDTLANLAARYGTTAWVLASANGLANPNLIEVGQVLSIPGR